MQKLFLAGTVGKDAVLRRTQDGEPVLGFSLAVDNGKDKDGNDRPATWYDCSVWGKRGDGLSKHITKGTRLALTGRPTARAHEGKAYLGIKVDDLTFQGGSERRSAPAEEPEDASGGYGAMPADFGDSDIPFAPEWR